MYMYMCITFVICVYIYIYIPPKHVLVYMYKYHVRYICVCVYIYIYIYRPNTYVCVCIRTYIHTHTHVFARWGLHSCFRSIVFCLLVLSFGCSRISRKTPADGTAPIRSATVAVSVVFIMQIFICSPQWTGMRFLANDLWDGKDAIYVLDNEGYRHTLRMCNSYCFPG